MIKSHRATHTDTQVGKSKICSVDCTNVNFLLVILNYVIKGVDLGGAEWKVQRSSLYISL